jgi:hypothetical protein
MNVGLAAGLAAVALVVAGGIGYLVGHSSAPSTADAERAEQVAYEDAFASARDEAAASSREKGRAVGQKTGSSAGTEEGGADADAELAAATPAEPLVQLPNGELGYALPEEDRTLGCIGIEADTGQCVGD